MTGSFLCQGLSFCFLWKVLYESLVYYIWANLTLVSHVISAVSGSYYTTHIQSTVTLRWSSSPIEEGFIQKKRQRSSLLLCGQIASISCRASYLHRDDLKNRLNFTRTSWRIGCKSANSSIPSADGHITVSSVPVLVFKHIFCQCWGVIHSPCTESIESYKIR